MVLGTYLISPQEAVKGAATDASESDNDTPTFAVRNAPQSFAPSPHITTW